MSRENDNHPLTNGTYDDRSGPLCTLCNQPVDANLRVLVGELSYAHPKCWSARKSSMHRAFDLLERRLGGNPS